MLSDIIAAVSTPRGQGGIAVIRISGSGAIELSEKIFSAKSGKALKSYPERYAVYGDIYDEKSNIDSGMLTYFVAPRSFTGEDMVEISCHGGYTVTAMVLSAVLEKGARMADAGEFTRRAFINNKISLTEAEAIGDLLTAEGERAVRLSARHIDGVLSEKLEEITGEIISLISSLYASIDYPEEDLEDMDDITLLDKINDTRAKCTSLISTYKSGHAVAHGINTVIVGKPNVGKSSFFNLLLSAKKAIVTDIPGTTRDVLEQSVEIDGVVLRLFDTAGIRKDTSDEIEKVGVDIAKEKISEDSTELILPLFDLSRPLDDSDREIIEELKKAEDKVIIPVFTKSDLASVLEKELIEKELGCGFAISGKTGEGIDTLKKAVIEGFITSENAVERGEVITNIRQITSLKKTVKTLDEAEHLVKDGMKDMGAIELERAVNIVGEIDSRTVAEKVVNEIFSKFCVGK